jgi:IS30 family transposase
MPGAVLSAHEREEIHVGIEVNESLSDIARRLDQVPSTITREAKRNVQEALERDTSTLHRQGHRPLDLLISRARRDRPPDSLLSAD